MLAFCFDLLLCVCFVCSVVVFFCVFVSGCLLRVVCLYTSMLVVFGWCLCLLVLC